MLTCKYCEKICKNSNSHRNHERLCPKNPTRNYVSHTLGKPAWNKGLNKKDNPELADKLCAGGRSTARMFKETNTKPFFATSEFWTEERRKKKSEWRKRLHKETPDAHPNRKLAGNKNKMSYPERVAFEYLQSKGVEFEHNKRIGKYWVDFCIGNVVIEIDGEYWHDEEKDNLRDVELNEEGYTVYRIKAKSCIENEIEVVLDKI
jgi:very-short-patch-repair endonuclease